MKLIYQPIRFFETYYNNGWYKLVIRRGFFGKYVIKVLYSPYRDHDFSRVSRTATRDKEVFRGAVEEIKRLYNLGINVNLIYKLFDAVEVIRGNLLR
jgi:hypothetical protein